MLLTALTMASQLAGMTTDLIADTPAALVARRSGTRLEELVRSATVWMAVCLVAGAADAFIGRHAMNPDGISYIDIARTAVLAGPRGLINGYWSPGYPALIAAALRVTRPLPAAEFPVVHALNFAIFAASLWAWHALLQSWINEPSYHGSRWDRTRQAQIPLGFGIFILMTLAATPLSLVTPDLAVLGTTLLIALWYQRLRTSADWTAALLLGASCALGFWMKTVMFPIGASLLVLLLLFPPPIPRARAKVLAAVAAWLVLSAPLIVLVSIKVGRPSYGETGRVNYASYVLREIPVDEETRYNPALVHPPRVLLAHPHIIEFGTPITATYAIHFDQAYWAEGSPVRVALGPQVRALAKSTLEYARQWLFEYPVVLAALIGLAVFYRAPRRDASTFAAYVLVYWGAAWLALYAAIHVETRLTAPAFLLLAALLARRLSLGASPRAAFAVSAVLAGFVVVKTGGQGWTIAQQLRDPAVPPYLELAGALGELGLTPGSQIAVVGTRDAYQAAYAHAAGLRVVAEIFDADGGLEMTNAEMDTVRATLARAGIRAIVRTAGPLPGADSGWRSIHLSNGVAGVLFTSRATP